MVQTSLRTCETRKQTSATTTIFDPRDFGDALPPDKRQKLEPGRCRYGVMLSEAGFILDDGVIGRRLARIYASARSLSNCP